MWKVKLYCNTFVHLRWIQILYQIKRRVRKKKICCGKGKSPRLADTHLMIDLLDLDEAYASRFHVDEIFKNYFTLAGERAAVKKGSWHNEDCSHLWNYNLHYFEYGIAMAAACKEMRKKKYREKFLSFINHWIDHVSGGDGWEPYTISLRLVNWLIAFELLEENPGRKITDSMYIQYRYLLKNQEKNLLGNHFFENIKTIVVMSLYFGEEKIFRRYISLLCRELREQILEDGVHFELSLLYHKVILEDMMRLTKFLSRARPGSEKNFLPILKKMGSALWSLERGMGKTPHFNDAGEGVAKEGERLCQALKAEWGIEPEEKNAFARSGYYKLYAKNAAILFDCGELGPSYMCGHSHCDALSFELSVDQKPVLVNSGTFRYQGALRPFFRSTRAHNTVMIAGAEQSELWGEHRAARRIRRVRADHGPGWAKGSYRTYKGYGHQRMIAVTGDREVRIEDVITGPPGETASAFFHAAPGLSWEQRGQSCCCLTERGVILLRLTALSVSRIIIHREDELCAYSQSFGVLEKKEVLEIQYKILEKTIKKTVLIELIVTDQS